MVVEDIFPNMTDVIGALPSNILEGLGSLILILKAIGVLFIIYFVYLIINGVISWKGSRRLKFIEKKVKTIERKLDFLVGNKKRKKKKEKNVE